MADALHLNLDDAWETGGLDLPTLEAKEWGRQLRFSAPRAVVEDFFRAHQDRLAPFILYGSGDFHHLSALWLRKMREPDVLVSFDNHPDWDVRPPKWACGGWINRALELPQLERASVWGCGNFECWWPAQFFGNRRAERSGKLEVHPWGENHPARSGAIFRESWRDDFERFADELRGRSVYITIDLDCLRATDAVTNWENGRFTTGDLVWAIRRLRSVVQVIGGDVCGAYSPPKYARAKQRFAAEWDHPKMAIPPFDEARRINGAALEKLWPILTE